MFILFNLKYFHYFLEIVYIILNIIHHFNYIKLLVINHKYNIINYLF